MKIIKLSNKLNKNKILEKIGSTKEGNHILKDKMGLNFLYLKEIKNPAALILKQDALSVGADLVVHKDTILCKKIISDALLIATNAQLKKLSKKEKLQPFGLKEFAKEVLQYSKTPKKEAVKLMGVVNANEDSFFEGSRFKEGEAIKHIEVLIKDKADIIDIGGVSSRPGSVAVSEDEELKRVKPIIDGIYKEKLYEKVDFSLDSYSPKCLEYALERGFSIVNDITALSNDEVAKVAAKYKAKVILMHMKGTPKDMQKNPTYDDVLLEVYEFFKKQIDKAKNFGINDIVLDVGIGFGKTLEHNLLLLKHLEYFLSLGYPLLVGASRKSMIDMITPSKVKDRLPGTLALHLKAVQNGATVIRCHDVKEHYQALKIEDAFESVI